MPVTEVINARVFSLVSIDLKCGSSKFDTVTISEVDVNHEDCTHQDRERTLKAMSPRFSHGQVRALSPGF
jgi:hypothetical protein